jgi:hypothetical protein
MIFIYVYEIDTKWERLQIVLDPFMEKVHKVLKPKNKSSNQKNHLDTKILMRCNVLIGYM